MSTPGRPKCEYRRAKHRGFLMRFNNDPITVALLGTPAVSAAPL